MRLDQAENRLVRTARTRISQRHGTLVLHSTSSS
jgi:hypothetical protein